MQSKKAGIPENTTGGGREKKRYCRARELQNTNEDRSKKGEKEGDRRKKWRSRGLRWVRRVRDRGG